MTVALRSRPTLRAVPRLLAAHRVQLAYALARGAAGEPTPGFTFYATCASCSATVARSLDRVPSGHPHCLDDVEPVLRCDAQRGCQVCGAFEINIHAEEQQQQPS